MARKSYYNEHRMTVLKTIHSTEVHHSAPPTVRELAELTGVGVATMHLYLNRLAEEGLIEWRRNSPRSLRCTPQASPVLSS